MMYLQLGTRPYPVAVGLTEVPLFWMDFFHMEFCSVTGRSPVDMGALGLERPGLKVFDIHPVPLALNTESVEHYARSKHGYHDPAALRRARHQGSGVRTLFTRAVERL